MQPADTAFVRPRAIASTHSVITGWGDSEGASVPIVRPGGVVELRVALLSSVAAERPRASNPFYGAAKAGLEALAQGLSDAVASSYRRLPL